MWKKRWGGNGKVEAWVLSFYVEDAGLKLTSHGVSAWKKKEPASRAMAIRVLCDARGRSHHGSLFVVLKIQSLAWNMTWLPSDNSLNLTTPSFFLQVMLPSETERNGMRSCRVEVFLYWRFIAGGRSMGCDGECELGYDLSLSREKGSATVVREERKEGIPGWLSRCVFHVFCALHCIAGYNIASSTNFQIYKKQYSVRA